MNLDKKNLLILGLVTIVVTLVGSSIVFGQTIPELITDINAHVKEIKQSYQGITVKEARADATNLRATITTFCQDSGLNCTDEIDLIRIGIGGASKDTLVKIIQNSWVSIQKKVLKKKTSVEQIIRKQTPKLVNYAGSKVPKDLLDLYSVTDIQQTVKDTTNNLSKMVIAGSITETQVEGVLRDVFSTASIDTGIFATGLMDKYSLQNVAVIILQNPKDTKALTAALKQEIEAYAEQEINKLANQALATMFPIFQGVQIDFTNLSSKTLKSTLRSTIINAMAQSYLGPQYVAVYIAVSTVCPSCMEKTHAELRRFDKKYLQPGTEKMGDEWGRFEDRVKAESERVGKQIADEFNRLRERISAEFNRQKEQVESISKKTLELYQDQLKKAQESRIGKEIERQLTDIYNAEVKLIDIQIAEFKRQLDDFLKAEEYITKQEIKILVTQFYTAEIDALKSIGTKAKNELKREVKTVADAAQKAKEKVEAELKRVAKRLADEYVRELKQIESISKDALKIYQSQLEKAKESRIGKEIERQLNDVYGEAGRTIDNVATELENEFKDILKENERLGKKVIEELNRQALDQINELKRLGTKAKNELQREIKTVANAAQSAKEKVEAELKRAADRAVAEAQRAADRVKAEANRLKEKAKKVKKKMGL